MNKHLLQTKLYMPPLRENTIRRDMLLDKLNQGLGRRLTLVSAQAGFGKTSLLVSWLHHNQLPVAWVTLDAEDNEVARFLQYLIAAFQTIDSTIGKDLIEYLATEDNPRSATILTKIINTINTQNQHQKIILVLDDYHLIENQEIDKIIAFLLQNMPPQLHLVITSRADPDLPLSRLRVRQLITEIRTDELRFSTVDAKQIINKQIKTPLSDEQLSSLVRRTEGWAAGIHLATLSMRSLPNIDHFVTEFSSSNRYIMDYLTDEVLEHQSPAINAFMVQTSILDRLYGPLCDALLGGKTNSADILKQLESLNLFIVPLDDKREWYRYHHLFAELLRNRLYQNNSEQVSQLHLRAAQWYLINGDYTDAIRHVSKSENEHEIERIFTHLAKESLSKSEHNQVLRWLKYIPQAIHDHNCQILLLEGYLYVFLAQTQEVRSIVAKVNALLSADKSVENSSMLMGLEAYLTDENHDLSQAISLYQTALEGLDVGNRIIHSILYTLLGLAMIRSNNVEEGFELINTILQEYLQQENLQNALIMMTSHHSLVNRRIGYQAAFDLRERLVKRYEESTTEPPPSICWTYNEITTEYFYRSDLNIALLFAEKGLIASESKEGDWLGKISLQALIVLIWYSLGRKVQAETLLSEILLLAKNVPKSFWINLSAVKMLFLLKDGLLIEARSLANQLGLSPDAYIIPVLGYPYLIYARVLIELDELDEAKTILDMLAQFGEDVGSPSRLVNLYILQAVHAHKLQDKLKALDYLTKAVVSGAEHRYVRLFLDDGADIFDLLPQMRHLAPAFVDTLLKLNGQQSSLPHYPLMDALTDREMEVLILMSEGLSNPQIAEKLFLAVGTVKRHAANIYSKLGVSNRTAAVMLGQELNLF